MELDDLERFLVIAETENMQLAAEKLDSSSSVLSKSLRRLEDSIDTLLFDRQGKFIRINAAGRLMQKRAARIVAQARQTKAEFLGLSCAQSFKIAGPSILQFRWASVLSRFIGKRYPNSSINLINNYELQALNQVIQGTADFALITSAIADQIPAGIASCQLGNVQMQVAAASNHPLIQQSNRVSIQEVLNHSFAVPSISPYCGEARGVGCDGWQNQIFPRKQNIVVDDYSILSQIVRSGQALAYLPDYWLRECSLVQVEISDCPHEYHEQILLVSHQQEVVQDFLDS
ncbi:MAG: LysR family transcriptional regulator [Kangiellaceae bacterium]|nr:LysR family transcriptional regulator [Kangiellaceae bacterium]MCW9000026.1 LysR family transcriptional regulator [Kangiellaceae bacterium]